MLFIGLETGNLLSQELTGDQMINKVTGLINQNRVYGNMRMTIMTTSGQERTFEYESWSKYRGAKNLVRSTAPRRVKDQAVLMLNNADDIWYYFPRTKLGSARWQSMLKRVKCREAISPMKIWDQGMLSLMFLPPNVSKTTTLKVMTPTRSNCSKSQILTATIPLSSYEL